MIRDKRVIQLVVNPVLFNPVSKQIKVYTNLELRLEFSGEIKQVAAKPSLAFENIYKNTILNYNYFNNSMSSFYHSYVDNSMSNRDSFSLQMI